MILKHSKYYEKETTFMFGIGEEYVDPAWVSVANDNAPNISTYASSITLNVPLLTQNGYTGIQLNGCSNLTIASSGCTLTSFTMILNYLSGSNYYPTNVNTTLGSAACPFQWYTAADEYNLSVKIFKSSGLTTSYVNSELATQLSNGYPVIIGMQYNNTTHFVVVKGYRLSGSTYTFYINDPNSKSNKTTLGEYLSAGATIHRFVVYGY